MHDICTTLAGVKTKWLASRELSARPGRALAAVRRAGRVLVTANGKPKAIMIPTSEETFSRDLEMLDRVTLTQAVEAIRTDSVVNGTDALTMGEIDAEVAAVRAARRRK
jgi:antitoxin (DNA-binding transcriptional repressor) of toxin-antitoxin stability system